MSTVRDETITQAKAVANKQSVSDWYLFGFSFWLLTVIIALIRSPKMKSDALAALPNDPTEARVFEATYIQTLKNRQVAGAMRGMVLCFAVSVVAAVVLVNINSESSEAPDTSAPESPVESSEANQPAPEAADPSTLRREFILYALFPCAQESNEIRPYRSIPSDPEALVRMLRAYVLEVAWEDYISDSVEAVSSIKDIEGRVNYYENATATCLDSLTAIFDDRRGQPNQLSQIGEFVRHLLAPCAGEFEEIREISRFGIIPKDPDILIRLLTETVPSVDWVDYVSRSMEEVSEITPFAARMEYYDAAMTDCVDAMTEYMAASSPVDLETDSGNAVLGVPEPASDALATSSGSAGSNLTTPVLLVQVAPEYSNEAREAAYQGTVILEAIVRRDGTVEVVRVDRSQPFGLDDKAIEAVTQWRFRPGMRNGEPVDVALKIEVDFNLR